MPSTGYLYYKSIKCSNLESTNENKAKDTYNLPKPSLPTWIQPDFFLRLDPAVSSHEVGGAWGSSPPFGSGRHQGTHCAHCPRLCLGDQPPPGPLGSGLPPRAVSSLQSNWPLSRPAHHNEPFSLCLCVSSLLLSRTTNYAPPITLKIPGGLCVHTPSGTVLCRLFLERCGSAPQPL